MPILTVKEGQHHFKPSSLKLHYSFNRTIHMQSRFTFKDSCRYYFEHTPGLQINKLYGLAKWHHHIESCRVGYRYNVLTDKMDLYIYPYYKGKRLLGEYLKPVTSVPIDEEFIVNIEAYPKKYYVYINSKKVGETPSSFATYIGYELEPYFGGKLPSPHEMVILKRD